MFWGRSKWVLEVGRRRGVAAEIRVAQGSLIRLGTAQLERSPGFIIRETPCPVCLATTIRRVVCFNQTHGPHL